MSDKILKLGEILHDKGIINREQLVEALEIQRTQQSKLGKVIVDKGWIDDDKLTEILADMFQMPFVKLSDIPIDQVALKALPSDLLETYKVFPVSLKDKCLSLATGDPLNVAALQDIQFKSGFLVEPVMASLTEIETFLQEYADSLHTTSAIDTGKQADQEGTYIVQLVDSIIRTAVKENASDIHFQPLKNRLRVRYRIDGVLYEKSPISNELSRNVISRIKIMASLDVTENRKPQDGRFSFTCNAVEYDIRLSTLTNVNGEDLVLRLLNKEFRSHSFESLGMKEEDAGTIERLIHSPYGLILVTGPTGAGKTTTLYSILNRLNHPSKNIISVEDPVEYEMEGINQTTNNPYIGYTFATAMRSILRHDPDIIMIGEIRDVETAEAAIRAALTGHLVLSTMHTNTAAGAITRLLEMDIEPFLISSAINGVIAQRLVRVLCPHCKKDYSPFPKMLEKVMEYLPETKVSSLASAKGCNQCLNTGYWGRTGVFEILEVTPSLREMILHEKSEGELAQKGVEEGMKTLRADGMLKAARKITSIEEVLETTSRD